VPVTGRGGAPVARHDFATGSWVFTGRSFDGFLGMSFYRGKFSRGASIGLALLLLAGCASTDSPVASAPQAYVDEPRDDRAVSGKLLSGKESLNARIAHFARLYNIPESLIHRSVRRESNYNPAARHGPYFGLMQIRHDTARGMGYDGPASGLLDAETNLTYAVPYLANAFMLADGSETRAIQLYAGGYYYEAKRRGLVNKLHRSAKLP
jgi:soluble lytic murein transglycosylase-like protein